MSVPLYDVEVLPVEGMDKITHLLEQGYSFVAVFPDFPLPGSSSICLRRRRPPLHPAAGTRLFHFPTGRTAIVDSMRSRSFGYLSIVWAGGSGDDVRWPDPEWGLEP